MNLLVSDYDGTLKRFNKTLDLIGLIDFKRDLLNIKKFINNGNLFVISTKRMYESMKDEIKKYNIPYSYLTLCEGLITIDKNDRLIYSDCINKELINFIKKEQSKYQEKIKNVYCYDNKGKISYFDKDEYTVIGIKCFDTSYLANLTKIINDEFPNLNISFDSHTSAVWMHNNTTKQLGIERLISSEKLEGHLNDIITVGDRINDYPMLINNDGYVIKDGSISELFDKEQIVPNIRKLIKK